MKPSNVLKITYRIVTMHNYKKKNHLIFILIFFSHSIMSMTNLIETIGDSSQIDLAIIDKLHNEFQSGDHGYIDSFLLIQNEKIIFEKFYQVIYQDLTRNKKSEQARIMNKN